MKRFVATLLISSPALFAISSDCVATSPVQSKSRNGVTVQPVIRPANERSDKRERGALSLTEAAARNAQLSRELNWTFGNKPQRGWYIYIPLIKRLISTKEDAATAKFAQAVSRWQAKSGLKSSGVLDEE